MTRGTVSAHPRMRRESRTITAMILIYCHDHHSTRGRDLCSQCKELNDYCQLRLEKCRYQEKKTTCLNCPTHCYKKDRKEQVRRVMRYSGPKMTARHPYQALMHIVVDGRRKVPLGGLRRQSTDTI